jgi:hypothetical protein
MWWVIAGVGILSTVLMLLYDKFVKPSEAATGAQDATQNPQV